MAVVADAVATGDAWATEDVAIAVRSVLPLLAVRVANSPSDRNSGSGVGGLKWVVIRGASGSAPSFHCRTSALEMDPNSLVIPYFSLPPLQQS